MPGPVAFLSWSLTSYLAILAGFLFYGLLSGRIVVDGILEDTLARGLSADRVQLLTVSLSGAGAYSLYALEHVGATRLPDIPGQYLAIVGSSQGLYLVFKIMRRLGRL